SEAGVQDLFGQEVFRAGGRVFRWEDVVRAAELWGAWNPIKERALLNLALLALVDTEAEAAVPQDEVDAAADDFRYERDLITAEELEEWLAHWRLDAETWLDWIHASLLRDRLPDFVPRAEPEEDLREVELALLAEAVCSGELARLARQLAARAAISERERERAQVPHEDQGSAGSLDERGEVLARLELSYQRFREEVLTPDALAARVKARLTDWTRINRSVLRLQAEDAAREVAIAVRQEGADLGRVAEEIGEATEDGVEFLDEAEPEVRDILLSARPGELVGPVSVGGEFVLVSLRAKIPPAPDDPEVLERAESSLLEGLVTREVDNRITWLWKP
ncbi:MAG: hypothetical protein ACXVH0_06725, partial [Thermoanaerobaculia bacterium]